LVNDSSGPISWCFLNYVVSLMVEWTKTQISFYELVGLISSNTHLAVAGTSRWNWLFEDCSTLFIFSRYFLIGHVWQKYILGQSKHVEQKMHIQWEAEQTRFCTMALIS
jgi:hypothetical protein